VVELAKNQLLRDFRHRSVFDFCNKIEGKVDSPVARPDFGILTLSGHLAVRSILGDVK
jgi:hypothetical protein